MIVIDASAVLELLLRTDRGERIESRVFAPEEALAAPHLLDVEFAQVLRRLVASKEVTVSLAEQSLRDYADLRIERFAHVDLLSRIWQLRNSMAAYDAAYVALAEALGAPLLTCDARLGRSHGHRARIQIVQ
ncbi:MAG: type II toxin-antitoxin system VapC family toxin [Burkholderiaceae bacterium]|nr:type II toxin-antitoxin system VapC family toxin [Burkholderiaceae bacterium]